jgi:hypothetical protein
VGFDVIPADRGCIDHTSLEGSPWEGREQAYADIDASRGRAAVGGAVS